MQFQKADHRQFSGVPGSSNVPVSCATKVGLDNLRGPHELPHHSFNAPHMTFCFWLSYYGHGKLPFITFVLNVLPLRQLAIHEFHSMCDVAFVPVQFVQVWLLCFY